MPSLHIPEGPFSTLVDEYGYKEAKSRVKDLVSEEARRVNGAGDEEVSRR